MNLQSSAYVISGGRRDALVLGLSLLVHGVLLGTLTGVFGASSSKSEVAFEVITLNRNVGKDAGAQRSSTRKRFIEKRPPVEQLSASANEPDVSSIETAQKSLSTGESEIDGTMHGRPPESEIERYLAQVRDQIARQQAYPVPSRTFREEGTVKIRVTLDPSGALIKVELLEGSPHQRLNDAAMKAAARAAPFPRFPAEASFFLWKIILPIRFALARS